MRVFHISDYYFYYFMLAYAYFSFVEKRRSIFLKSARSSLQRSRIETPSNKYVIRANAKASSPMQSRK